MWPDHAGEWYGRYEQHYWQHRWKADGFREFPKDMAGGEWYMDVDSGPVLAGHGIAACAFGVGAARANGRLDHAYPLTAEMLVTSWPLLNGTLAGPRVLSNAVDAPYLGEAGVLFALTRHPVAGTAVRTGGRLPSFFYILLAIYLGIGLVLLAGTIQGLRRWHRQTPEVPLEKLQVSLWALMIMAGICVGFVFTWAGGAALILGAQLLPRARKKKTAPPQPATCTSISEPTAS